MRTKDRLLIVLGIRAMESDRGHGPESIYWDNLGEGFRIECLCGWVTDPNESVQDAGYQFDEHLGFIREINGKS